MIPAARARAQPRNAYLRAPVPVLRCSGGFTLLELMIALALVAMMVLLLFSGLRLGTRTWDAVDARSAETADRRLVAGFIQRTLVRMVPVSRNTAKGQQQVFAGERHAVEYATPLGDTLGLGGLSLLRLQAEKGKSGFRLVLRRWLYHPEVLEGELDLPEWRPMLEDRLGLESGVVAGDDGGADRVLYGEAVLLEGLEKIEFSYFGKISGAKEPEWQENWHETRSTPALIRVNLVSPGEWWPEIVVALPGGRQSSAFGTGAQGSSSGTSVQGAARAVR